MVILFTVNISLVFLDEVFIFTGGSKHDGMSKELIKAHDLHPLFHVQIILMFNHLLQIIFKRHFYGPDNNVNRDHPWVWGVHLISYIYVIYAYLFTDMYS